MKNDFLHIVTLPFRSDPDNLSHLAEYYNHKIALQETIAILLKNSLDINLIQGKKVLLKPNWVKHSSKPLDELCLRTNDKFTIAVLIAVLEMNPLAVVIGDAPIQGCIWNKMISQTFINEINSLSKKYNIPVKIKDFRRRIYNTSDNSPVSDIRPLSDYVIFDLGERSLLEPITVPAKNKFRVTNYNPDRMSMAHAPGVHKYCISKDFFDADIVISIPKIKTHQKTGITGALKILVGINGDKDFLPHHRIGGTGFDGDCYPGSSYLRYWSEILLDKANRNQGTNYFWFWQKVSSLLWILSFPGPEHNIDAGWYGNHTTWRMVIDLNKIAEFGRFDGTMSDQPQRQIFSICDGIVGGQGDGPLNPEPLPLGIISLTNNSTINDRAMAMLMGLQVERIPLVNHGSPDQGNDCEITLNGENIQLENLKQYSIKTLMPKGWTHYLNGTT